MVFDADKFWSLDDLLPESKKGEKKVGENNGQTVPDITLETVTFGGGDEIKTETLPPMSEEMKKRLALARAAVESARTKYAEKTASKSVSKAINAEADAKNGGYDKEFTTEKIYSSENITIAPTDEDKTAESAENPSTPDVPEVIEYVPDNALIRKATVKPWQTRFAFHERFRENALRFYDAKGTECEYAPFFSYSPTYIQLGIAQKKYYFYWRERIRNGEFLPTTQSYILLYVSEIINTPEKTAPDEAIRVLCSLYLAYGKAHEFVRRMLPEWVLDYCLIFRVTPTEEFCDAMAEQRSETAMILRGFSKKSDALTEAVLSTSTHKYRQSAVVTEENAPTFDRFVPKIAYLTVKEAIERNLRPFLKERRWYSVRTADRPSFSGLTCAYPFKRMITTERLTVPMTGDMTRFSGEIIKYAENKVRAMLGIKNRYHITELSNDIKDIEDRLFAPYKAEKKRPEAERPEYEKLYDVSDDGISAQTAEKIEEDAWQTTRLLTDNEDFSEPGQPAEAVKEPDESGEIMLAVRAVEALFSNDGEDFSALAKELNVFPDALADGVNETLFDIFGDNVVETDGQRFFIDYYKDDVNEWLEQTR